MSAHELDAMASIACADVDGLSVRGHEPRAAPPWARQLAPACRGAADLYSVRCGAPDGTGVLELRLMTNSNFLPPRQTGEGRRKGDSSQGRLGRGPSFDFGCWNSSNVNAVSVETSRTPP